MINSSILQDLQEALAVFPVVLLCGARQVGKSTLVLWLREHYITLDDITLWDDAREDPRRFIQELPCPTMEAVEAGVSLNRIASAKLAH